MANIRLKMANEKVPKVPDLYECKICDYISSRLSQYDRHLSTDKHIRLTNANQEPSEVLGFACQKCKKNYKHQSSLCKHFKTCSETNINAKSNVINDFENTMNKNQSFDKNLIIELLQQNQELQKQLIELATKSNNITNNTNTNNTNCNNSFNLQVFLNEKCKNALNMSEFIDTIKMQLSDLENFAQDGYADGVYKIFVKGLNALDTYLRPIHCSDLKRETLFIKDNDCWTKETDEKLVLKNAIKRVAFKNIKQINEWILENPGCKDPRTKKFDKYNKIVMNSMSGTTIKEQQDNIDKIVKNITKAVIIEKNALK